MGWWGKVGTQIINRRGGDNVQRAQMDDFVALNLFFCNGNNSKNFLNKIRRLKPKIGETIWQSCRKNHVPKALADRSLGKFYVEAVL